MAWMRTHDALTKLPALLGQGKFSFTFDRMPLVADHLSLRKKANLLKCGLNMLLGSQRLLGLPAAIQVEPTNTCNLKCPLCPTGTHSMSRGSGMMSAETFRRILDDLGDVLTAVVMYGWGEPFLNRNIPDMIEACTARNILTVTSTNGHCLQTIDEALRVVDAGLTALVVAMDGSTQQIYQAYRQSGDVAKVKRCIRLIEEAKTRRGAALPYTNLRVVVTQANEGDLPNLEQFAREAGVNMFSCKSVGYLSRTQQYRGYQLTAPENQRFRGDGGALSSAQSIRCYFPFRQPTIFWDGTVVGCEFDYELEMPWGRIGEQPFAEIWNSPQAREVRRRVRTRANRPVYCVTCPYSARGGGGSILRHRDLRPATVGGNPAPLRTP